MQIQIRAKVFPGFKSRVKADCLDSAEAGTRCARVFVFRVCSRFRKTPLSPACFFPSAALESQARGLIAILLLSPRRPTCSALAATKARFLQPRDCGLYLLSPALPPPPAFTDPRLPLQRLMQLDRCAEQSRAALPPPSLCPGGRIQLDLALCRFLWLPSDTGAAAAAAASCRDNHSAELAATTFHTKIPPRPDPSRSHKHPSPALLPPAPAPLGLERKK